MNRHRRALARRLFHSFLVFQFLLGDGLAVAGDPPWRARRTAVVVRRAQPCAGTATSTLGTFFPTPYITVRGNAPLGGGYSPLEIYGDQTLALYGPVSPLRTAAAPVLTYVRGYDGRTRITEATSFSNPNLPVLSPVRYPNEGNYYYGPRVIRTTPWGLNASNWIDQN
jgi:hypothetical protein